MSKDNMEEKQKKYVCILEDEDIGSDLVECFEANAAYEFKPVWARTLRDLCDSLKSVPRVDVGIIDLWLPLEPGSVLNQEAGIRALRALSPLLLDTGAMLFVYTAHADMDSCIKAMQYGARDYVDKVKCSAMNVVDRVVERLHEGERRLAQYNRIVTELIPNDPDREKYSGKCVAVLNDKIVGAGDSRLEALLDYWGDSPKDDLPVFRYIGKGGQS